MSKVSAQAEVEDILAAVRPNTCLVTIMLANNETGVIMVRWPTVGREASAVPWMQLYSCGPAVHVSQGPCPTAPTAHPLLSPHTPFPTVPLTLSSSSGSLSYAGTPLSSPQPVPEISRRIAALNPRRIMEKLPSIRVHSDAAQAVGKWLVDVGELGVDFLTIVGHKVHPGEVPIRRVTRANPSPSPAAVGQRLSHFQASSLASAVPPWHGHCRTQALIPASPRSTWCTHTHT